MDVLPPELVDGAETTRTSSHRSAPGSRVEVLTRAEPRRSWTVEQKREIVAESLGPELTPTEVVRKHRISSGQLYTWRQQLLSPLGSTLARAPVQFAAVDLEAVPPPVLPPPGASRSPVLAAPPPPARPEGLIEVVLPGGVSVRVDAHVDGRALRRVLGALEGR